MTKFRTLTRFQGRQTAPGIGDKHFVLTESAIALILSQVCEALRYVHAMGIVHLDVKVS